jgi:hypothetical protein
MSDTPPTPRGIDYEWLADWALKFVIALTAFVAAWKSSTNGQQLADHGAALEQLHAGQKANAKTLDNVAVAVDAAKTGP